MQIYTFKQPDDSPDSVKTFLFDTFFCLSMAKRKKKRKEKRKSKVKLYPIMNVTSCKSYRVLLCHVTCSITIFIDQANKGTKTFRT